MNPRLPILPILLALILIPLLTVVSVIAQVPTPPPQPTVQQTEELKRAREELEKKAVMLLDELIAESASLALIENRIFVRSKAIEILWKYDEPRARVLTLEVMNQIMALNASLMQENDPNNFQRQNARGTIINLRHQIVNFLASKDPRLALEFLRATRPQQALNPRKYGGSDNENALESMIAVGVAENDPQRAMQMADEILKTGVNTQLIQLWNTVRNKDPQLGARLQGEIMNKLKSTNLLSNYDQMNAGISMLHYLGGQVNQASNPSGNPSGPPRAIDSEAQLAYQNLLEFFIGTALKLTPADLINPQEADKARNFLLQLKGFLPAIEKQLPSRAEVLRTKLKQFDNALYHSPEQKYFQEYQQKMHNKSTQELLDLASKAPQQVRDRIYHQAIYKAMDQGDRAMAEKIAKELMSNPQQGNQMLAAYENMRADRLANEGKFDEARRTVSSSMPDEDKARYLARWSRVAIGKNDESAARQFLEDALAIVGDKMQTRSQLEIQLTIAGAYLDFDTDRSFEIAGSAVERLNKVIEASFETSIFNGMAEGEKHINSGEVMQVNTADFTNIAAQLFRKDFDRSVGLLKRFDKIEVRMMANLTALQVMLGGQPGTNPRRRNNSLAPLR